MSLEGAKIICLNDEASERGEIIPAQGKTFKFGYYMDCDVILEHPDAMGLQVSIDCDAFGRVTIENRSPDQPVQLNGTTLKKIRPLLHNTQICIFDKKFLWQFEAKPQSSGFLMEDASDFQTPCKAIKKFEQAPNSEPARRWRTKFHKRLTIHSFAYCIKAGESPKDVQVTTDENKPLNTYERIIPVDCMPEANKRLSPPPSIAADLIDLKTPKVRQRSLARPTTPLSCCKLSETVITSYSPRETGVRPEKSFAIVQSPATTPSKTRSDVSPAVFQHLPSPLAQNYRPSMHLIDLTTPKKRAAPQSPVTTLLKTTLKKNIPSTATKPSTNRRSVADTPATSMESIYSVPSTDDESVIELSDEGNFSPSPVRKTPVRKTPQSLMKHAILSSAKKAAITKKLQLSAKPTKPRLLLTPKNPPGVCFQSQSTPQRKSLVGLQALSATSQSVAGKGGKPMITSTPFRAGDQATSRRSILRSPSTSLTGVRNKSRNSLMLKQALLKSPQTTQKRKSVSFSEPEKSQPRKSVSFLDRLESEDNQSLNQTFSIEEKEKEDVPKKDATFSPKKETYQDEPALPTIIISDETGQLKEHVSTSQYNKKPVEGQPVINVTFSPPKSFVSEEPVAAEGIDGVTGHDILTTEQEPICNLTFSPPKASLGEGPVTVEIIDGVSGGNKVDQSEFTVLHSKNTESTQEQTPQTSKSRPLLAKSTSTPLSVAQKQHPTMDIIEDDDFEGLDSIFKTPKAKNLMILGSPKSISLQKPTPDSVELIHSTEFDLSANLDDIFKTPQSEFITNRMEADSTPATGADIMETFSPEEAFDMLVGRPITRKTYASKTTPPKQELPPLNVPRDQSLPKTDIEEWIDSVNESINMLGGDDNDEDEMSYFTATQNEMSRDPLMMSSIVGSVSTTNRKKQLKSPKDESAMTIQEEDEEERAENMSPLKDPLEVATVSSAKKTLSPNISGIDLLDHTSESLFSETLEVSDESDKTIGQADSISAEESVIHLDKEIKISPDKARREIEEAFKNFEQERKMLDDRLISTPEPVKPISRENRRKTLGNQPILDALFDVKKLKEEREMEIAFENFNDEPEFTENRAIMTPKPEKVSLKDHRRTMGSSLASEVKVDFQAAKAEWELQLAFANFKEEPEFSEERMVQTPEPKKATLKDHRRTMGSSLVPAVKLDLEAAKAEREMELAFANFEEEPEFCEERMVQTPEPKKATLKDHRRTMGSSLVPAVKLDLEAAKAEREMELAFANFEEEPEFFEERMVQTPEPKKATLKDHRRTMGSSLVPAVKLDLEAAKAEREMELAFANFEEEPEFCEERMVQTPEPKKATLKDHRRTMGSSLVPAVKLDLEAAKAEREMELAFANFEEEPEFCEERMVQTPEPKKATLKDHRRTMGSSLVPAVKLDLEAAKAEREMELAFANFEEEPEFCEERMVQTPKPKKATLKDHRRTMGSSLVSEVKLDLQAAKNEREMELAFANFEEEPEFSQERMVQTPEPKKATLKDHRRTLGSSLVPAVKLDLEAAKAEREMELAFANFEEEHEFCEERMVQTPEPEKATLKDHRRTMGSSLVSEVKLDLQAAKAEREMELAFANFEEEPEFSQERMVQTPEPKKATLKDHRRTMGSSLVSEVKLDLQAAKDEREMELAFANFEDEPEFSQERMVQTPEPKKAALKDHRRTMGSSLVPAVKLDLEAAKAEREMELAFANFEEEPEFSEERIVQTPEPKKATLKDRRRTLGSSLVSEVKLDLQAAKAEREMELAFANFEDKPEFSQERMVQTPEPKKATLKDHRRTMGSSLVSEVKLDLQAAKDEREMEFAFANFEDEPEFSQERMVQTPEPKKAALKDHRRTMGSSLVPAVKLDIEAAKAEREMELAFANFEEEPEFSEERIVQTPEPKKATLKDRRRTLGSSLVSEVKLDLQAAKAEREMELAFANFEDEPEFSQERMVQTPEPKKATLKDHRRTMGSSLVSEVKLDLQAAKDEREMELAFANFEDEPEFSQERMVQTPEPKKATLKDHRRTMGSSLVSEVKLDLQAAKDEREMELAFANFEEEPEFSQERMVHTPEPKKATLKDQRRTMGSSLVSEVKLDLQAAKDERETELAFANFEEEPKFSQERMVQTPEPKKATLKDHRRTMGSSLVSEVKLDLQAAKDEREMELAFANFKEKPEFSQERMVQTPEPKKATLKDHRRTLGSSLVSEVKLDLQAAKDERETELAFANFEEEPKFSQERMVQTPEPKKATLKDHRRTMGSSLVSEVKLDLQAAKDEREMELAFANFEEEPEFSQERMIQTPEPKKATLKDHRRTMGSSLVSEVKLDLQAAKDEREMELAFANFEEEPKFSQERMIQTPEPKKATLKDHRRTMGSSLVSEVKLDLQAAKDEREMELAFANFEDEPEFSQERMVQTPEPKKATLKDHRRTMGSSLVSEVKLDLQAAKAEREMELAFANFEDEPEFSQERMVQTPEPKKATLKDHRRTMGSSLVSEVKLDLQAAKDEREMELAFANFEDEPEFSQERMVQTPEPKKATLKDHRRTMGSSLVSEVKLDLQAAKDEREMELAFANFEEEPEFSQERMVQTPEPKKATLKDHRRTMGTSLVPEVSLDIDTAKAEPLKYVRPEFQNTDIDEIVNIPELLPTETDSAVDKKPIAMSDDVLTKYQAEITETSQPIQRRQRQKTMDDVEQLKQHDDEIKTEQLQTRTKKTRQNSTEAESCVPPVDTDGSSLTKSDSKLKYKEGSEANQQIKRSARPLRKLRKKTNSDGEVESTDDEAKTSSKKKVITITTQDDAHQLDPIAEEERKLETLDADENAIAEPHSSPEKSGLKPIISLNAEVDEITSTPNPSNNRIRGRRAQLSVVLVESKTSSSYADVGQPREEIEKVAVVKEETTAADEIVPCTPAPLKPRGRRPSRKDQSAEIAAPALRRGRRGSVQQDNVEEGLPTTPVPTLRRGRRGSVQQDNVEEGLPTTPVPTLRRGRQGSVQQDNVEEGLPTTESNANIATEGDDATVDDVVPYTPQATKSRLLRLAPKLDSTEAKDGKQEIPESENGDQEILKNKKAKSTNDPNKSIELAGPTAIVAEEILRDSQIIKEKVSIIETNEPAPAVNSTDEFLANDEKVVDIPEIVGKVAQRKENVRKAKLAETKSATKDVAPPTEVPLKTLEQKENAKSVSEHAGTDPDVTEPTAENVTATSSNNEVQLQYTAAEEEILPTEVPSKAIDINVDGVVTSNPKSPGRKPKLVAALTENSTATQSAEVKSEQEETTNSISVQADVDSSTARDVTANFNDNDVQHSEPAAGEEVLPTEATETNVESVVPKRRGRKPQPRGRAAAVKSKQEETTSSILVHADEDPEVIERIADDVTAKSTDNDVQLKDTAAEKVVLPTEVPSEAIETNGNEVPSIPKHRGRKPKLVSVARSTPNVTPSKTRGRRGAVKLEQEETVNYSSVHPKVVEPTEEDVTFTDKNIQLETACAEEIARSEAIETNVPEVVPSNPKQRGRKPKLVAPSAEVFTKIRGQRAAAKSKQEEADNLISVKEDHKVIEPEAKDEDAVPSVAIETNVEEVVLSNPKSRGRKPKLGATLTKSLIPDVLSSTEVLTKTRGRKAAVKLEQKNSENSLSVHVDGYDPELVELTPETVTATSTDNDAQHEDTTAKETNLHTEVLSEAIETNVEEPVPLIPKPRGRKPKLAAVTPSTPDVTPINPRGRKGDATTESVAEHLTPARKDVSSDCLALTQDVKEVLVHLENNDVSEQENDSAPVPSKTRGRRGAVKSEADPESSSAARGRGRRGAIKADSTVKTESATDQTKVLRESSVEKTGMVPIKLEPTQITPDSIKPSRKRGLKGIAERDLDVQTEDDDVENEVPCKQSRDEAVSLAQSSTESATVKDDVHSTPVIEPVTLPKKRGRAAAVKSEPTTESSTPARKRGRRGAVQEETNPTESEPMTASQQKEDEVKPAPPKKRGRPAAVKSQPTADETLKQDPEVHTVEENSETVVISKQSKRPAAPKSELIDPEAVSRSDEATIEPVVLSKKRGRAAAVKSEPLAESSTPVRKRGRRGGALQEDSQSSDSPQTKVPSDIPNLEVAESASGPSRQRGRAAKPEEVATAESITPGRRRGRQANEKKSEEESTDSNPTPVKSAAEVKSNSRPIRTRRASAKEDEPIPGAELKLPVVTEESEDTSQKKPIRGRKAAPKKDTTVDSTPSHTGDEQPVAASPEKTKPTRGRKTAKKDTQTEAPSEDEVKIIEQPIKKPSRSRKALPVENVIAEESQPTSATKKNVRGRKAAVKDKDSDDEDPSSHSETQKKATTRISKPEKEEEAVADKPVPKRTNRRNVPEILAEVDEQNTPSKRIRRKPKILLSDEFVH